MLLRLFIYTVIIFPLSEIGAGWVPAIINSTSELVFIGEHHKMLSNNASFWIGGSTLAEGKIELSDYMVHPSFTGKEKYGKLEIH